ncbi:MAG: hypothetical protein QGH42_05575 [Kiritimatiellia bacterium]|jgi:hypothetical protein|nr:hypothetical protein [Kiritimatiellia bacterium]MDP6630116.1 hypothetical protein [Kiritimatiellia bacterium]MDP6810617.1 hypothetical protein [Kiritimatiellia bacterium]MDP7023702.1 hypothetical protein [Kiritimatiellia bacterium]
MTDENKTETTADTAAQTTYSNQGRIAFYHANSKGTGAALRFEFKPPSGRRNGCFFMEMAKQKTKATGSGTERAHATFDWESKATVKLSFMDACEFLAVLQLKQPGLGTNGKGLYHVNGDKDTVIGMRTNTERKGYTVGISRKDKQGQQIFKGHFLLSPTEAIGLESIFSAALFHMAFGHVTAEAA